MGVFMVPWSTVREGSEYAAPLDWIDPDDQPDMGDVP